MPPESVAATALVEPLSPNRRSPTPPKQTVTSVHGGYVFTDEDVAYLHKYIDYCKDVGLMLRYAPL